MNFSNAETACQTPPGISADHRAGVPLCFFENSEFDRTCGCEICNAVLCLGCRSRTRCLSSSRTTARQNETNEIETATCSFHADGSRTGSPWVYRNNAYERDFTESEQG